METNITPTLDYNRVRIASGADMNPTALREGAVVEVTLHHTAHHGDGCQHTMSVWLTPKEALTLASTLLGAAVKE